MEKIIEDLKKVEDTITEIYNGNRVNYNFEVENKAVMDFIKKYNTTQEFDRYIEEMKRHIETKKYEIDSSDSNYTMQEAIIEDQIENLEKLRTVVINEANSNDFYVGYEERLFEKLRENASEEIAELEMYTIQDNKTDIMDGNFDNAKEELEKDIKEKYKTDELLLKRFSESVYAVHKELNENGVNGFDGEYQFARKALVNQIALEETKQMMYTGLNGGYKAQNFEDLERKLFINQNKDVEKDIGEFEKILKSEERKGASNYFDYLNNKYENKDKLEEMYIVVDKINLEYDLKNVDKKIEEVKNELKKDSDNLSVEKLVDYNETSAYFFIDRTLLEEKREDYLNLSNEIKNKEYEIFSDEKDNDLNKLKDMENEIKKAIEEYYPNASQTLKNQSEMLVKEFYSNDRDIDRENMYKSNVIELMTKERSYESILNSNNSSKENDLSYIANINIRDKIKDELTKMNEVKEDVLEKVVKEEEKKTREDIVNGIIKDLENGTAPWRKGHHPPEMAYNYMTDKPYQGLNAINLTYSEKGSKDPRWMTYKQAQEANMQVRKGEKGESVIFFRIYDVKEKKDLDKEKFSRMSYEEQKEYAKNIRVLNTRWTVFNGSQIDGMPPYERPLKKEFTLNELEQKLLSNSKAPISFDGGDKNFYRPTTDTIHLAPMENFISKERFVSTLCHEISHSTGHETRLNRELMNHFGTPKYAKEELVAELSTVFTMTECGLRTDNSVFENNKAYLANWAKALKDDVSILNKVSTEAGKACDYIKENVLEIQKTKTKTNEMER